MSLLTRLPSYYRNNPAFVQIAKNIMDSSCRFSGLFFSQKDDLHLLLKDGSIHVQLDWQAFSLLRATSSLIISSGEVLRSEPGIFKKHQDYDNKNIKQLYEALQTNSRQKLFILSRKLAFQQIKQQVNEKTYQILELPNYNTVHQAISQLYQKENLPMSIEFGMVLLNQYFNDVRKGAKNHIDTLLISKFTCENIHPKYIGPKFAVPIHQFYQPVWKSVSFPCEMSNGQKGQLSMEIHTLK